MRMTNQAVIDPELVELFYKIYAGAFAPIASVAAARHVLTSAEFAGEMADERIEKHVFWSEIGEPVALATYTRDLSTIPWISPAFYARRYPEHAARNAIVYMGYSLVHPAHQGRGVMSRLLDDSIATVRAVDGVGVFDVCAYNDARQIGYLHSMVNKLGMGSLEPVDTQTYYAVTFGDTASYVNRDKGEVIS
jgi:GNAT superfamily N-acetyltransferase